MVLTTPPSNRNVNKPTKKQYYKGLMDGLVQQGSMTAPNENPNGDVGRKTPSFLRPKRKIKIGAWNVRTIYEVSKIAQVTNTMQQYGIDIQGVSIAGQDLESES
jgi:hypothetical protein